MDMNTKKQLGLRIKELRKARKLSQEKLAEKADISTQYLSRIEIGQENPTLDLFIKLAVALEVELGEIFNFGHTATDKEIKQAIRNLEKTLPPEKLRLAFKIIKAIER